MTQEAIRNYEDIGRSEFHFHLDDAGDVLGSFVFPHIRDLEDQQYLEKLDIASAEPEDLPRAISLLTGLPKTVRNKIFTRNLRNNYASTLPRELSSRDPMYYSKE